MTILEGGLDIELRTLRYFVAVADAGSVTAAADLVHVTQPSLSRQLHELERQLGVTLFIRGSGRLRLSAAGREFLPVARDLVAHAASVAATARDIAAGRLRQITIAAPGTTLTDVISPFLATFTPDDPMPAVSEQVPSAIYASLRRGVDLAIGTTPPPAALQAIAVAELLVWAYPPAGHPWAGARSIDLVDLVTETLLVQTVEFHPRRALDEAVSAARLTYERTHEFTTAEVAQAVAAAGRGVAVVSDDPRFGLRPSAILGPDGPLRIHLYAAWEPEHHGSATIADISRRLALFCVDRYGDQLEMSGA